MRDMRVREAACLRELSERSARGRARTGGRRITSSLQPAEVRLRSDRPARGMATPTATILGRDAPHFKQRTSARAGQPRAASGVAVASARVRRWPGLGRSPRARWRSRRASSRPGNAGRSSEKGTWLSSALAASTANTRWSSHAHGCRFEGFVLPGEAVPGSSSVASPTNNLNCVGAAGSGTRPSTTSLRALAWAASTPW